LLAEGGQEGAEAEEKARRAAALAEWRAKLIVSDPTFHAGGARTAHPGQLHRCRGILKGAPQKLALMQTHAPPAPVSMFLNSAAGNTGASGNSAGGPPGHGGYQGQQEGSSSALEDCWSSPQSWLVPGVDFARFLAKEKSAVAKPGFDQSWWGSLHDPHLQP
jgi:hypothetical protein